MYTPDSTPLEGCHLTISILPCRGLKSQGESCQITVIPSILGKTTLLHSSKYTALAKQLPTRESTAALRAALSPLVLRENRSPLKATANIITLNGKQRGGLCSGN
jgi:hypothetical protein